jgi:hypothetical protein
VSRCVLDLEQSYARRLEKSTTNLTPGARGRIRRSTFRRKGRFRPKRLSHPACACQGCSLEPLQPHKAAIRPLRIDDYDSGRARHSLQTSQRLLRARSKGRPSMGDGTSQRSTSVGAAAGVDHLPEGTHCAVRRAQPDTLFTTSCVGTLEPWTQPALLPYRVCTELFVLQLIESTGPHNTCTGLYHQTCTCKSLRINADIQTSMGIAGAKLGLLAQMHVSHCRRRD